MFGDPNNSMLFFAQIALLGVVMWFFMIRPKQMEAKAHKAALAALRRGDRVVTGGGIVGTIAKVVDDNDLLIDIADNVRVRVKRATIASVLAKTEPVAAKSDKDDADKTDKDDDSADKAKGKNRRAAGGN
jgi:preprotein translocase subunit YajC